MPSTSQNEAYGRAQKCFSLSFELDRLHRDLHSFPTRRSSDLTSCGRSSRRSWRSPALAGRRWCTRCRPRRAPCTPRSEEHTSELQSPCNLVCRLLLEKKKFTAPLLLRMPPCSTGWTGLFGGSF